MTGTPFLHHVSLVSRSEVGVIYSQRVPEALLAGFSPPLQRHDGTQLNESICSAS